MNPPAGGGGTSGGLVRWLASHDVLSKASRQPRPAYRIGASAGEGACRLLGRKCDIPSGEKEASAWIADLRERLKPVLDALSKFEKAAAAQLPPAPAPPR